MILLIHWLSNKIVWENSFFVPEETNAVKTSPFPTGNANILEMPLLKVDYFWDLIFSDISVLQSFLNEFWTSDPLDCFY